MSTDLSDMTIDLFDNITKKLARTPIKFHYIFNLNDVNKIYQGVMQSDQQKFEGPKDFVRLWRHELKKVIEDRLMTQEDRDLFSKDMTSEAIKKKFPESAESAMADPIL
jgi:dynein heavy chain